MQDGRPGARPAGDLEELLRPTVTSSPPAGVSSKRPWRLQSQVYIAVLGGALGVGIMAIANARRLGLAPVRQLAIAALVLAGLLVAVLLVALVDPQQALVAAQLAGVVVWGGMYMIQRTADRIYSYHCAADEPYAPFVGPVPAAALLAGLVVQLTIVVSVVGVA